MLITILAGIIVLSVLILVHEFGHFIMAKATGCWVKEFGIGFPPRLWGKKYGDTIYSINWIPFGGFNSISGEVDPKEPRAMSARSHAVRLLVLGGGMLMNLILPVILLAVAYMVPHDVLAGQVQVQEVAVGSPAEMAGIKVGDIILRVNGKDVTNVGDLSRETQLHLGAQVTIELQHADAAIETVSVVPRWKPPEGQGAVGLASQTMDGVISSESLPFWRAIPRGVTSCWETLVLYKNGIIGMIIGAQPFVPAGPVGIVQVTGEVAHAGISPLLELAAFISIAVAITQLIPFPSLDGSRMLFVVVEWLRKGKRISPKVEGLVHSVGFMVLIVFMVLITYQDLARWITGGSLIK
ncbi:MAG: M50 family metallopeptidase [Dehalococcoidales bacterium]|jgi:regulator of sigma E protease